MIIDPMEWIHIEALCENEMYGIAKDIVENLEKQGHNKMETKWKLIANGGDLDDFEEAVAQMEDGLPEITQAIEESRLLLEDMLNWDDNAWLNYIILNGSTEMNSIVPRHAFPAYDIALGLQNKHRVPTQKQWLAITNVYMWTTFGAKFSDKDIKMIKGDI